MFNPRRLLTALALLAASTSALAMTPREIMQAVDDRDDGDRMSTDMEMHLIDKQGQRRVRTIRRFAHDVGEDKQFIMFFLTPADVKETGFLTYDYDDPGKDDDQWLYLPALRKSKRIASSDKSGSFMGSDFNYSDMTRRNLDAYDFTLVKEDKVGDVAVWIIQAEPKSREEIDESGYSKSLLFVRQDNFVVVRAVHWVADSSKLKYFDVKQLELIDGVWTIRQMEMTTRQGKVALHKTELYFNNVQYNYPMDDDLFTVRRLEMGL